MRVSCRRIETPPRRLYVVGDIHGCREETSVLLSYLRHTAQVGERDLVIFIGDYIDRGPDSRGVVDLLLNFRRECAESIFLGGNHEEMLRSWLGRGGSNGQAFVPNGGRETLLSYGVPLTEIEGVEPAALETRLPPGHLEFFLNLEPMVAVGGYVFVHAGIDPLEDLDHQSAEDVFWIRDAFIRNTHRLDETVVFGHTPWEDVLFHLPWKIGIDTGLVYGNMLTCVELMNGHLFQVRRGSSEVEFSTFPRPGRSPA